MKIKSEHYKELKAAINKVNIEDIRIHYLNLPFHQNPPKDIGERLRWDCLQASKIKIGDGVGMDGLPLYQYMDDSHIDTALRSIFKELKIDFYNT